MEHGAPGTLANVAQRHVPVTKERLWAGRGALVVGYIAFIAAVWTLGDPPIRLAAALAAGLAILWGAWSIFLSRIPPETIRERATTAKSRGERRSFLLLRALTDEMIDRVRELNNAAMDAKQGRRSEADVFRELSRIEREMKALVERMREAAGKEGYP